MEDATESSIHLEDSPTNFIEMEISTKNYIETVLYTYVIRVVCAVGIFGNVAILVVLSRRGAKETAFVYIRALAAVDLVICVSLLGMGFVRCGDCSYLSPSGRYWGKIYEGFIYLPIANAGQMANLFITMTMAVHRVASIIQMRRSHDGYALRINVRRSRKLAHRLVVVIVLFSVAINVMRFFFHTVQSEEIPQGQTVEDATGLVTLPALSLPSTSQGDHVISSGITLSQNPVVSSSPQQQWAGLDSAYLGYANSSTRHSGAGGDFQVSCGDDERHFRYKLEKTDFYRKFERSFLYALTALHFGELLILTSINFILIRILRVSKKQRKNLIRGEIQQRKRRDGDDVTRMLIVTVIVHIVCHLPSPFSIPPITDRVFGRHYTKSNAYQIQLAVNNTLTLTSHAITFFLYLVSRKFRKQVRRTWDCLIHHFFKSRRALHSPTPNNSWTPTYLKGGVSPILNRQQFSVGTLRFL